MKKILVLLYACLVVFGMSGVAGASTIDVLWYGANSSYNARMGTLASTAGTYDPKGDGSFTWNLTMWNAADPTPVFSNYDVLVIGCPNNSFWTGMDPARLLSSKSAIEAARGSRTFLSGQAADQHYWLNSPIHNGPGGFLIDAVNWAAGGTGLGIVSTVDGWSKFGSQWWLDPNSFLRDELNGYVTYFQEESVVIPSGMESHPVNEGLTSKLLTNWGTSVHAGFVESIPGYSPINDVGTRPGYAVTIIAETPMCQPLYSANPIPGAVYLLGSGLAGIGAFKRWLRK